MYWDSEEVASVKANKINIDYYHLLLSHQTIYSEIKYMPTFIRKYELFLENIPSSSHVALHEMSFMLGWVEGLRLIIAKYLPACCNVIKTNGYCDVKHFISFKIPSSDIGKEHQYFIVHFPEHVLNSKRFLS